MRTFIGDIFGNLTRFDSVFITTNGFVKHNGACVMGAGIARVVRDRFPGIDRKLGAYINKYGNRAFNLFELHGIRFLSFPVKHNWWEQADIELIRTSAQQAMELADKFGLKNIALPQPGCGNGKLDWSIVEPVLSGILDDRFIICSFK